MTTQSILGCFERAADLMTRCARGRFGKESSSIDSGFKIQQKHCAIRRQDHVQTAEIVWSPSRKHGGHFLGWDFLGMRLRSDEILIGTTRGLIKTRTLRRRVEEGQ